MSGPRKLPPGVRRRLNSDGSASYQARWRDRSKTERSATFDTPKEAGEFLVDLRRRMRNGASGDPSLGQIPFAAWWDTWQAGRHVEPSTMARDLSYGRSHILPRWGDVWLIDVTFEDAVEWVSRLKKAGIAPATQNKAVSLFKQAMAAAVDADRLAADPVAKVKAPPVPKNEAAYLDDEELELLELAVDLHWRLMIPFMVDTGLRIGEVAAVRVRDLDLDRGLVRIRKAAVYVSKQVSGRATGRIDERTKTTAAVRVVPTVTPEVAERLAAHIEERGLGPDDLLFTGPCGGPLNPGNWRRRVFDPAVERAGLAHKKPTPHSIRHSAISIWISERVADPYKLSRWAGHENFADFYRLYAHLLADEEPDVRRALGERRRNRRTKW